MPPILAGITFAAVLKAVVIAVVTSIVTTALSLLLSALFKPKKPPPPSRERQQAIREAAQVRAMNVGRVKIAADAHLIYDANDNNQFIRLMAMNWGPIDAYEALYLNNELVTLDGSNLVTGSQDGKWDGIVSIHTTLGSPDQLALPQAKVHYPIWTDDHRAQNVALAWVRQVPVRSTDKRARHIHGELAFTTVIRGAADIYDPRTGTTGYSDNNALVLLWYLRHPDGRNWPDERIDFERFKTAANICDELVPLRAGGTERRYRCAGQIRLDEDPNDVIRDLLENMDATPIFNERGQFGVLIGNEALAPELVFEAHHVLATQFRAGSRAIDRYNRVAPIYISPEHNFMEITPPAYEDAADVAANGATTNRLELRFCPSAGQAQRLAKRTFFKLNPLDVGAIRVGVLGLLAQPGATIRLGYDEAETTELLRVMRREIDKKNQEVTLHVRSIPENYEDWDPAVDERLVDTLPLVGGSGSLIAEPQNVQAFGVALAINQSTTGAGLRITWDDPGDDTISAEAEFAIAGSDIWTASAPVPASQGRITFSGIDDGQTYDAQVRFIGGGGGKTEFVTVTNVTIVADSTAIAAPEILMPSSLTAGTPFEIQGTAPASLNLQAIRIYRSTTDDQFSSAFQVNEIFPNPGAAFAIGRNAPAEGNTHYYWSKAVNTSGVLSTTPFGPVSILGT